MAKTIEATPVKPAKKNLPARISKNVVDKPGDWKAELSKYAAKTVKMEESTQTGNRISTRGGKLSYHGVNLRDNKMTVIVLAALIENAYYAHAYDPDNPSAPVCFAFSEDGENMEPHEKSHDQQSESCDGCPHNEWGSADRGKGKACKNIRRLALLACEDVTAKNIEEGEIATLSVSVTSVKGWSSYARQIALNGSAPWAWQTVISLERPDGKDFSNLFFEAADRKPISEKFYPAILKRVKEAEKLLEQPYVYVEPPAKPERKAAPKKGNGKKKF